MNAIKRKCHIYVIGNNYSTYKEQCLIVHVKLIVIFMLGYNCVSKFNKLNLYQTNNKNIRENITIMYIIINVTRQVFL